MNPDLTVHPLYTSTSSDSVIEDNLRMNFTRVRLCSHRLRSETGRWNRVPADQRFCPHCNGTSIQNEERLFQCPATLPIRERFGVNTDLPSLMNNPSKTDLICPKQCRKLLESINGPESDEWMNFQESKTVLGPFTLYLTPVYLVLLHPVNLWKVNNNNN